MDIKTAIHSRRTIRFFQQKPVADELLRELVDAARVTSCAGNQQRLRFVVARTQPLVNDILAQTAWGRHVMPRRTPVAGETGPAAFLALVTSAPARPVQHADAGAAVQSIQLAATELGLGCCWLGSVNRDKVAPLLGLDASTEILYIVAVGYPAEQPVSEDVPADADLHYYLDEENRLHVPKLELNAVSRWL